MIILHLETSSKNCSVAISKGNELLCLCEKTSQDYKQSENLHTYVEWALEGAEISIKDLDAVSIGMGPGSYTGLRVGTASAKGFCFGLNIPLIAINSLEIMVEPFLNGGYDYIIPLIDARRMEVYTAVFDGELGKIVEATNAKVLAECSFQEFQNKKVLFVGDGCVKAKNILQLSAAEYENDIYPSAKFLIKKSRQKFIQKEFEDIAHFEPFYLKDFRGTKRG